MAAVSGIPPSTEWSDCSKQDLEEGFLLYNLNWCLTNEPNITDAHPMCGNGIREGDEACDCGNQEVRLYIVLAMHKFNTPYTYRNVLTPVAML